MAVICLVQDQEAVIG